MRALLHRLLTATLSLSLALTPAVQAGQDSRADPGKMLGASGDSLLGIAPVAEGVAGILSPAAILDGFGDALVSGALSVAQNGGSFGDAVLASFVSSLTAQAMAALQHGIGDLTLDGLAEGSFGHVLLHGTVGCAFAEVSGGDCAAGFAAGAAQALYAGYLEGTGPVSDQNVLNTAELIGAFAGFVFSSGKAENVSSGASIAQSGALNNYLTHGQFKAMQAEIAACGEDIGCIKEVLRDYRDLSLEQEHELALCGNDIVCLSKHLPELSQTVSDAELMATIAATIAMDGGDAELQNLWQQLSAVQDTALTVYGIAPSNTQSMEAFAYAYSQYPEWAANNCGSLSSTDCMATFQQNEVHGLGGLVHDYHTYNSAVAMYTIGAGGAGVLVARTALVALATCISNPVCLNNLLATLPTTVGEAALGLSGASAGQAFITVGTGVLAGKLLYQHGDEILSVIDEAGRFFTPLSQEVDDAGRFLVQAADGTIGYLDEASGFVPVGTVWDNIIATANNIPGTSIPATFEITVDGQSFWVNANATEHFGEYLTRLGASGNPISSQQMLSSFHSAVAEIVSAGPITMGQSYNVGGWEIVFQQNATDRLPVIIHALPIQ